MFVRISCLLFKLSIQTSVFLLKATGFKQSKNLQFTIVLNLFLLCEDGARSQWPRGLRRRFTAARLLRS